jgi:predicted dehydrogenase
VRVRSQAIGHHSSGITSDQVVVTLGFADGSVGTLIYTAGGSTALPKERLEVFGSGRSAVLDDYLVTELYAGGKLARHRSGKRDKGFATEMEQFVAAITRGTSPGMAMAEVLAVSRATIRAAASLRSGEEYDV